MLAAGCWLWLGQRTVRHVLQAVEKLGRLEDGGPVQEAFIQLANKAAGLASASRSKHTDLAVEFEGPLKDGVRVARAVGAVCADRTAALTAVSAARSDLDAKKVSEGSAVLAVQGRARLLEQQVVVEMGTG
jgi:hypothetical protein